MTFTYREDIDWLRAIAVLAVVAFHFEAPAVFGGFVGVDIFFVISGYLITAIVADELKKDTFSFARFYERRVRRLMPALYLLVVLTAIPSFQYLLTSERAEFFRSAAAVVTFTSNFFFWFQTGYFDHAAVEKPLLHTWSLAVEEQFYHALAQQIARGVALVVIAIPIFSLRQGPGFPGFNALAPCIGAVLFIWSGIGVPTLKRSVHAPLNVVRFFGRISYSLYLWHWPLFTFARFSKDSLVLDATEKLALFALTVLVSYLSWRYIEQPFRQRTMAPTRAAAFRFAGVASGVLVAGSALGLAVSQTPSDSDREALALEAYNAYQSQSEPLYRVGTCFKFDGSAFADSCLELAGGKSNWLLWGDSLAAHYFHGLRK